MKTNCPQCNKTTESKYSDKEELHYFYCADCKIGGKGKTEKEAEKELINKSEDSRSVVVKYKE